MKRGWLARAWWYFAMTWVISVGVAMIAGMVYVTGWMVVPTLFFGLLTSAAILRLADGRPRS